MEDSLFIVIPAYNEELNIRKVTEDWYSVLETSGGGHSELVIVDDSSTDSTYDILCELKKEMPRLTVLRKPNSGHGLTLLYGYKYALEQGADYVFQTDSDNQTVADEFEQFWNLRHSYDMVIGDRNRRKDGLSRLFITKVLKLCLFLEFGVIVKDAYTPFRLMNAKVMKKYMEKIPDNTDFINVLLSVFFIKHKERVKFIPITFNARSSGKSYVSVKNIFKIGLRALKLFWQMRNI